MIKEIKIKLFELIILIRQTEEAIANHYKENKMRCPTHLSIGQEGIAAAVGLNLRTDDLAVSTHRAHAHYLAKGGNIDKMIAELYGKATGCSAGKGGSMHLVDRSVGFVGSTAIVSNSIPVGVGLALSMNYKKTDQISCIFLGDAAVEEGVFFESVNFAVLKNLPVLFICENNLYSVYSDLRVRQPKERKIYEMVKGLGIKSGYGEGNNSLDVYSKVEEAVKDIRNGNGPYFLEFSTYRWREHCGPNYDDNLNYRPNDEVLFWKNTDPLKFMQERILEEEILDIESINKLKSRVQLRIDYAFEFAEKSPFPDQKEAYLQLYSN